MSKKQEQEFLKRYDKFKNNNLPTPFWDKNRKTQEYVYYDDGELEVNYSIFESLGRVAFTGLYYPFTSGYIIGDPEKVMKYEVGHTHAHSFEEVVYWLYSNPEYFSISKEEEKYYSTQELEYLRDVKEYLLFIGMKDCKEGKRNNSRYRNKKQDIYKHYGIITIKNELQDIIMNGERDYLVIATYYPETYSDSKEYAKDENVKLVRNQNGKIIALLEFTRCEKKQYKDYKTDFVNTTKIYIDEKELEDDDYIIIEYFNILEKY